MKKMVSYFIKILQIKILLDNIMHKTHQDKIFE